MNNVSIKEKQALEQRALEKIQRELIDKTLFTSFKDKLHNKDIIEQTLEDLWVFMKARTLYIELKAKAGIKALSESEEIWINSDLVKRLSLALTIPRLPDHYSNEIFNFLIDPDKHKLRVYTLFIAQEEFRLTRLITYTSIEEPIDIFKKQDTQQDILVNLFEKANLKKSKNIQHIKKIIEQDSSIPLSIWNKMSFDAKEKHKKNKKIKLESVDIHFGIIEPNKILNNNKIPKESKKSIIKFMYEQISKKQISKKQISKKQISKKQISKKQISKRVLFVNIIKLINNNNNDLDFYGKIFNKKIILNLYDKLK